MPNQVLAFNPSSRTASPSIGVSLTTASPQELAVAAFGAAVRARGTPRSLCARHGALLWRWPRRRDKHGNLRPRPRSGPCGWWKRDGLTVTGVPTAYAVKWHSMPAPLSGPGRADLHLGQGRTLRPDTLMQTAQIGAQKPLADGAGHTLRAPLAVWLSMIAVVGLASRPAFSRTST